jgi:hypothetical protein
VPAPSIVEGPFELPGELQGVLRTRETTRLARNLVEWQLRLVTGDQPQNVLSLDLANQHEGSDQG